MLILSIGSHTPSPQCNLFFASYWNRPQPPLTQLFPNSSSFFELYDVVSHLSPLGGHHHIHQIPLSSQQAVLSGYKADVSTPGVHGL